MRVDRYESVVHLIVKLMLATADVAVVVEVLVVAALVICTAPEYVAAHLWLLYALVPSRPLSRRYRE